MICSVRNVKEKAAVKQLQKKKWDREKKRRADKRNGNNSRVSTSSLLKQTFKKQGASSLIGKEAPSNAAVLLSTAPTTRPSAILSLTNSKRSEREKKNKPFIKREKEQRAEPPFVESCCHFFFSQESRSTAPSITFINVFTYKHTRTRQKKKKCPGARKSHYARAFTINYVESNSSEKEGRLKAGALRSFRQQSEDGDLNSYGSRIFLSSPSLANLPSFFSFCLPRVKWL